MSSKKLVSATVGGAGLGVALVLRETARIPVLGETETGVRPPLVSSVPGLHWLLAALVLGAALGWLAARRSRGELFSPFLVAGLAAAVLVPGVFRIAPFLALIHGPLLDLILLLGLAASLLSFPTRWASLLSRTTSNRFAVLAFAVYLVVGWRASTEVGLSGDEPHYLLITYSVLQDGDFRVQDNYGNEDYGSFYRGKIGPHLARDTPYSIHGIGLPLVLLPGFALLGLWGVLVTEALIAALVVRTVFTMTSSLTESKEAALFAAVAFGLTVPAPFLAVSAYPELPAALVVVLVGKRLLAEAPLAAPSAALWGLGIGTLPFFHMKFLPLTGLLWCALGYRRLKSRSAAAALALGVATALCALLAFFFVTSGQLDPTATYGRQRVFLGRIPVGLAGLLFDQEFGLLCSAPVYWIGIAGLVTLVRKSRLLGVVSLAVFAAVAIPGAAHPLWSGGTSPPARFLFPALPLLGVAAGCLWAFERDRGTGPWARPLLLASLGLAAAMGFLPGGPLHLNARDGTGRLWEALSSAWDLTAYLPSVVVAGSSSWILVILGIALVVAVLLLQITGWRRGLPSIPLVLLAAAWVQDLAGTTPSRALEPRWVSDLMLDAGRLTGRRFVEIPSFETLTSEELFEKVTLPLATMPRDGDPERWWSRRERIPPGRFRLLHSPAAGTLFCNGEGCFARDTTEFATRVGLVRFRTGVRRPRAAPRLRLLEPYPSTMEALRSRSLPDGSRVHARDDEVFLDRRGFWVQKAARARFVLEGVACSEGCPLELENGGRENWVRLSSGGEASRFRLSAWERRTVMVFGDGPLIPFSLLSESGFRPSSVDPDSGDTRDLGVLVLAPAFDLGR